MIKFQDLVQYVKEHCKIYVKKSKTMPPVVIALTEDKAYIMHAEISGEDGKSSAENFDLLARTLCMRYQATSAVIGATVIGVQLQGGEIAGMRPVLTIRELDRDNRQINFEAFTLTGEGNRTKIERNTFEDMGEPLWASPIFRRMFNMSTMAQYQLDYVKEVVDAALEQCTIFVVDTAKEKLTDGSLIENKNKALGISHGATQEKRSTLAEV